MKVKELIEELSKQDPEMEVMIEQGEDYDYMLAYFVRVKEINNIDDEDEYEDGVNYVVIDYS